MNHQNQNKGISPRMFVSMLAVMLLLGCAVGGTIAWFTAKDDPVVNIFALGGLSIDLSETTSDYKIVPGRNIAKDPKVTVKGGSEKCYLFVKVEPNAAMNKAASKKAVHWSRAEGWNLLNVSPTNGYGVYWRIVEASATNQSFYVLKGNEACPNGVVTVPETLTLDTVAEIEAVGTPTLTFTAYAIQYEGFEAPEDTTGWNPVDAWNTVYAAYAPAATTDPSDAPSEP